MKELKVIENRTKEIDNREADFRCCSFNGECGMKARTRFDLKLHVMS